MSTTYITLEQLLVIHEDQIIRYEGKSGIRTLSLLESAILRPQSTFNGNELYVDLFEKAAALIHLLIRNHPFIDGNKRTGIVAGYVFLEINSISLNMQQKDVVKLALSISTEKMNINNIAALLQKNSIYN